MNNLVKADSGIGFRQYITYAGRHPFEENGMQVVLKFENGYGASIAYAAGVLEGVELQVFRYQGAWWEMVGLPFTYIDAPRACQLLMDIYSFENWRCERSLR